MINARNQRMLFQAATKTRELPLKDAKARMTSPLDSGEGKGLKGTHELTETE